MLLLSPDEQSRTNSYSLPNLWPHQRRHLLRLHSV